MYPKKVLGKDSRSRQKWARVQILIRFESDILFCKAAFGYLGSAENRIDNWHEQFEKENKVSWRRWCKPCYMLRNKEQFSTSLLFARMIDATGEVADKNRDVDLVRNALAAVVSFYVVEKGT